MKRTLLCFIILSSAFLSKPARADSTNSKFQWKLIAEHLYETMRSSDEYYGQRSGTHYASMVTALETPLRHGAGYLKLLADFQPLNGVWLKSELVAEHRGMSYGVYPALETAVFPRILFGVDTAGSVFGLPLWLKVRVGHFSDLRLQEGLTVYNIDVQGTDVAIGYKSISLRLNHIGDLVVSYGLNLDDLHNYLVEVNDIPIADEVTGRASFMTELNGLAPETWTLAAGLGLDSLRLYGSFGRRADETLFQNNWASLAGLSYHYISSEDDALRLQASLEYRFYSAGFNARRYSGGIRYAGNVGSHSIGRYLYPLDRIDRPFSTWALHTAYRARDVESGDLYLKGQTRLYRDLHLHLMGELAGLRGQFYGTTIYPFYDIGIAWQPLKDCYIRMSLTNRTMDLYEHFPSLFALKGPAVGYTLHLEF